MDLDLLFTFLMFGSGFYIGYILGYNHRRRDDIEDADFLEK